ncbi:tRNA-dihydrouridine synthase [Geotalea uraniireducens]|uniref:tRNA-dihydrouridine synthase n=1 Tax=Geotalea uraniireducens TaxID=351604 RepID=A0ABM8EJ22_9BACT|nr:tRNA dihydrouridine synthase DusB [Geotalea uraniireducens]BDV41987.1 tRNA-dihydrouridine synthase [Geotalea uraniireducens]
MITSFSIGSLSLANNLLLAPMAGITNLPFRLLSREQGAALCFTEMVSVNGLVREGKKSFELLQSTAADRPLGIQLFGDDPELLAEGARLVEPYGDLIDINMGCPVRKVVGSGAGSALLREPAKVRAIVRATRRATRLPLTIKIRSGWSGDESNFLEIARIAADEGCDAITLHPRSRAQMFDGHADWAKIAELKRAVAIPVIGSGDLFTPDDVVAMLAETGCDAVMVARGALGNPWIFREVRQLLAGEPPLLPTVEERRQLALRHLELFTDLAGERVAVREMRKHVSWYSRGIASAAQFRKQINSIEGKEALLEALNRFFTAEAA